MKRIAWVAAGALFAVSVGAAQAQFRPLTQDNASNSFGDTSLSFQNGIVYDDDLVPGRGPNQSFLLGDQTQEGSGDTVFFPPNSRQLIRPDGTTSRADRLR